MNPKQESLLLNIMEDVNDKLDKQQTKWWVKIAIIYGIVILLLGGLAHWNKSQDATIETLKNENHKLELRIQKLETQRQFEKLRIPDSTKHE